MASLYNRMEFFHQEKRETQEKSYIETSDIPPPPTPQEFVIRHYLNLNFILQLFL